MAQLFYDAESYTVTIDTYRASDGTWDVSVTYAKDGQRSSKSLMLAMVHPGESMSRENYNMLMDVIHGLVDRIIEICGPPPC